MPHKCVRCGTEYPEGSEEILEGCQACGSRLFVYVRSGEAIEVSKAREVLDTLMEEEPEEVLKVPFEERVETIRIVRPGTYEINLPKLLKQDTIVFAGKKGKYVVHLPSLFAERKKEKTE